jgi:hypothetical protein
MPLLWQIVTLVAVVTFHAYRFRKLMNERVGAAPIVGRWGARTVLALSAVSVSMVTLSLYLSH